MNGHDGNLVVGVCCAVEASPDAFDRAWSTLYHHLRALAHPGVVVAAVNKTTNRVSASQVIRADADDPQVVIVGSSKRCDIVLDEDSGVAPRHLAMVVLPRFRAAKALIRFRVLDLGTDGAFSDECGRRHTSIAAAGSVVLEVSDHILYVVVSEPMAGWPADPTLAFQRLRTRIFVDENGVRLDGQEYVDMTGATVVRSLPAPIRASPYSRVEGRRLGHLHFSAVVNNTFHTVPVAIDRAAADRGVLLGRGAATDGLTNIAFQHGRLSRVHLLVLMIDGVLYAIDAASSNGVFRQLDRKRVLVTVLGDEELLLGLDGPRVTWLPSKDSD